MRTLWRRLYARDLEFEPIALFEMVYARIKRQQELERVVVRYGSPSRVIIFS